MYGAKNFYFIGVNVKLLKKISNCFQVSSFFCTFAVNVCLSVLFLMSAISDAYVLEFVVVIR